MCLTFPRSYSSERDDRTRQFDFARRVDMFFTMRTIGLLLLTLLLTGCVRRELTVTSEPAGALVYLNGLEAGRTPFTTDFTYYGNYDVQVRREGTEPLVTSKNIVAPW